MSALQLLLMIENKFVKSANASALASVLLAPASGTLVLSYFRSLFPKTRYCDFLKSWFNSLSISINPI